MKMPTVSAVIPAYNAAKTIRRALDSVYAQTYDNIIEVIIADDGSTDDTAENVRAAYTQATELHTDNGGDEAARNTGIEHASGDYVAFLDADDEWVPEKTSVQIEAMDRHPGIGIVTCHFTRVTEGQDTATGCHVRIAGEAFLNITGFEDWLCWISPPPDCYMLPNASGLVVRRSLFDETGLMDETMPGSVEFLVRATARGYSVGVIGRPLSIVYAAAGTHSRSAAGKLEVAHMADSLISRYDPSGVGWAAELLSEKRYARARYEASLFAAEWANSAGDRALAARHLREALARCEARGLRSLGLRLGALSPAAYYKLSSLGRRVRGICGALKGRN